MNTLSQSLIFVSGVLNLLFAVFHLTFWRLFEWKSDLKKISRENSSIMQVLNLSLVVVFLIAAYVDFFHGMELLQTHLGRTLLVAWSLFWLIRAVNQPVFWGTNPRSLGLTIILILVAVVNLVPVVC